MYIAEIPNRTSPPAILLRESFRQDGRVRNRTLLNLSSWPKARIGALRRRLRGELDHAIVSPPTCGPVFGLLHALKQVAADLGIYGALGQKKLGKLALFPYDVTSSYLEGEHNALGEFGYKRDGKRGKLQIVVGLLADASGEPLAVRVFAGNTAELSTVGVQIEILTKQFAIEDVIFVGDRGMFKSAGKKELSEAGLRYISALTDPQIHLLLSQKTVQLELFAEQVCEAEADGVRYIVRKNPEEARRIRHRLEDKLSQLRMKIAQRNELVEKASRRQPEAGLAALRLWMARHKIASFVSLRLDGRKIVETADPQAELSTLELPGCYVIVTDVAKGKLTTQAGHDSYMALQRVERDFRTIKTGLLEIRPLFVCKESRMRGHVFCCLLALKLSRELERMLAAAFGTTDRDPSAVTVSDALAALSRLSLIIYNVDEKKHRDAAAETSPTSAEHSGCTQSLLAREVVCSQADSGREIIQLSLHQALGHCKFALGKGEDPSEERIRKFLGGNPLRVFRQITERTR